VSLFLLFLLMDAVALRARLHRQRVWTHVQYTQRIDKLKLFASVSIPEDKDLKAQAM